MSTRRSVPVGVLAVLAGTLAGSGVGWADVPSWPSFRGGPESAGYTPVAYPGPLCGWRVYDNSFGWASAVEGGGLLLAARAITLSKRSTPWTARNSGSSLPVPM